MNLLYKRSLAVVFLMIMLLQLSGCGETLRGVGKDWGRVGKGVKTIFVRDSE
ncbi:MAG: hypothetical protein ISS26_00350 [Candidatus Omnitrophica bacterium]|nr:hypothetical protein [Candidatus Omnitrophota bacterium]